MESTINKYFNKKCDKAENGLEAVQLYEKNMQKKCCNVRYKVVLSDIQMPVMDGVEATRRIREMERDLGRRKPIVAVTAYTWDPADDSYDSGAMAFGLRLAVHREVNSTCSWP